VYGEKSDFFHWNNVEKTFFNKKMYQFLFVCFLFGNFEHDIFLPFRFLTFRFSAA
jgi:hypothetical protein